MSLAETQTAHKTAGLVYCLWILGILFGITAIIGIFINHSKLASVRGTYAYSHFIWQIASFWTVLAGVFLAVILWPGALAQTIAIACFAIWLFSGIIGSWCLSKHKKLTLFSRSGRGNRHGPSVAS